MIGVSTFGNVCISSNNRPSGLRILRISRRICRPAATHDQAMPSHMLLRHLAIVALAGCARVHASQREHLASPAMQFEMEPMAESQRDSILEITEGGTFPSAGPGTAGAGCGCN